MGMSMIEAFQKDPRSWGKYSDEDLVAGWNLACRLRNDGIISEYVTLRIHSRYWGKIVEAANRLSSIG